MKHHILLLPIKSKSDNNFDVNFQEKTTRPIFHLAQFFQKESGGETDMAMRREHIKQSIECIQVWWHHGVDDDGTACTR